MNDPAARADSIMPVIPRSGNSDQGLWIFMSLILLGGVWLFWLLNQNRQNAQFAAIEAAQSTGGARVESPAPLALPRPPFVVPTAFPPPRQSAILPVRPLRPAFEIPPSITQENEEPEFADGSQIVSERPSNRGFVRYAERDDSRSFREDGDFSPDAETVQARRLTNPSFVIPQGTMIPAVLETAMDTTNPGNVRALVQRDITGFDGTRILIHRGSRLYGSYDVLSNQGGRRVAIQWKRLIRPDGVTIALDSPASGPLGEAGVKGDLDTKFLQRFGGAILQSLLDIGTAIATQEAGGATVIALPGSSPNVQISNGDQIRSTLKVKHGTTVTAFLSRDLDFSNINS